MKTQCETCRYYIYDEYNDYYYCSINLDEDEMGKFLNQSNFTCHYYSADDEYAIVRKQN